jgi:predicted RNase H-like HicB family nuclease
MIAVRSTQAMEITMKGEFTAIIEPAPEGGFWAICPEVPGANGQGETIEETKASLRQAIELILEDRKADILRGLPDDAIQDTVMIGWNERTWSEG